MKTIYLSIALMITTFVLFSNTKYPTSINQNNIVQIKLVNDSNETLIYYINGTKYEIISMLGGGLSYPENTVVKIIDNKTNKEKILITLSADKNGGSYFLSELLK